MRIATNGEIARVRVKGITTRPQVFGYSTKGAILPMARDDLKCGNKIFIKTSSGGHR